MRIEGLEEIATWDALLIEIISNECFSYKIEIENSILPQMFTKLLSFKSIRFSMLRVDSY